MILGYLADVDLLPRIREGDLRKATKKLAVPVERIEFLKAAELRQLFASAAKHDAEPADRRIERRVYGVDVNAIVDRRRRLQSAGPKPVLPVGRNTGDMDQCIARDQIDQR